MKSQNSSHINQKMNRILITALVSVCISFGANAQQLNKTELKLLDVPEKNELTKVKDTISYAQALVQWKSVTDINRWIGLNFHYDISRAIALGSKREQGPKPSIHSPAEMYSIKSGICVDISRFAFETLRKIDPEAEAYYLMIDFEPIEIQGSTIRKHWVLAYKQDNSFYVTADSKLPGQISGPYEKIEDFIESYEAFRQRKIVSFKLLDDYKKKMKKRLAKVKKDNKGDKQQINGEKRPAE